MSICSTGLPHDNGAAQARPGDEFVPFYASIETWMQLSGMSRRSTYEELGNGNLRAKKHGAALRIDVRHGLEFMRSLPDAKIKAPKPRHTTD
jgi:hypothetical protein